MKPAAKAFVEAERWANDECRSIPGARLSRSPINQVPKISLSDKKVMDITPSKSGFCSTIGDFVTNFNTARANKVRHPGQLPEDEATIFCFLTFISSTFNVALGSRLPLGGQF